MNKIEQYLDLINDSISKLKFGENPENLYGPIHYILSLGGKRTRPLLSLLSYELFCDGDISQVIKPSLAIECFHNFTLMHDDIMDKAPLRRGKPTVHERWDSNTAILSGDVMLVRVYDLFLGLNPDLMPGIISKFNDCAARVCEGQQLDMNYEKLRDITEDEYLEMIKLKTAVLIGFSLELGAVMGGAENDAAETMKECGINFGTGFQLKDDLLDVYGDNLKFGKQVGGDIIANKKTFLSIKASELARGSLKKDLEFWTSQTDFRKDEKVEAITAIYNQLGIKEITGEKIGKIFKQGLDSFERIHIPENRKTTLYEYIGILMDRDK
jgi:geranylgeranyl diphosphate synthase type II